MGTMTNRSKNRTEPPRPGRRKKLRSSGLDPMQYECILAIQGGGCGLCGTPPDQGRDLGVHADEDGHVHGLLCTSCFRRKDEPDYMLSSKVRKALGITVLGWITSHRNHPQE